MRNDFDGVVIQDKRTVEEAVSCHNLRVIGTAVFMSDVEAGFVDIPGEACFDVILSCDKLTIRGRCVCKCGVLASSVRVFGKAAVYGRLHTETCTVAGALKFRSTFSTSSLNVKPGALIKGSAKLRASKCIINGAVNNSGIISSINVDIISSSQSQIQEIRCESLNVKRAHTPATTPATSAVSRDEAVNADYDLDYSDYDLQGSFLLISDFIDCYTADLEACRIERLYCDSAVIRKGCVIHEILYRDSIEIEQGAHVERLSKT